MNSRPLETPSSPPFRVRLAAVAGLASGVILFINAAKRSGLIELSAATQLVAPLAQALAIVLVVGLAALAMRQSSKYSSVALALNVVGLAAATGAEWVINLVFVELDRAQIGMLRSGPLGTAFWQPRCSSSSGRSCIAVRCCGTARLRGFRSSPTPSQPFPSRCATLSRNSRSTWPWCSLAPQ